MRLRPRKPSPALIVSIIALVAAATGTAVALPGTGSVDSGDIENGALKEQDLAPSQRTLWALIDGSSDEVVRSSGGVTIPQGGSNFDYINFHENLKGRPIQATPQWASTPDYISVAICGDGNTEETIGCKGIGPNPRVLYVDIASGDGNYYITVGPK